MLWQFIYFLFLFGQETPVNNAKETNKKTKAGGGKKKKQLALCLDKVRVLDVFHPVYVTVTFAC